MAGGKDDIGPSCKATKSPVDEEKNKQIATHTQENIDAIERTIELDLDLDPPFQYEPPGQFELVFFHGGRLVTEGFRSMYVGGTRHAIRIHDIDKLCISGFLGTARCIGHERNKIKDLWWSDPGVAFGLKALQNDNHVLEMSTMLMERKTVNIYVEHAARGPHCVKESFHSDVYKDAELIVLDDDDYSPPKESSRVYSNEDKSKSGMSTVGRKNKCGLCNERGHNIRGCPERLRLEETGHLNKKRMKNIDIGSSHLNTNRKKSRV